MTIIAFLPEEMSLTFSWDTKINKAESGKELQRICQRLYPLRTLSITYLLADGDALRTLRDLLFLAPDGAVEIPFRPEALYATAAVTTTEVRVPQLGSADWAISGRRIYVEKDDGEDGYGATITGVATSGSDYVLTVDASPPSTYAAAVTRACPLLTLYPDKGPSLGNYRIEGGKYTLTGRVNLFAAIGLDYTTTLFDSMMIVTIPFNQEGEPLSEEYDGGAVVVGEAPFESVSYRDYADIIKNLTFEGGFLPFPQDWSTWKTFLAAMNGQQKTFLLPTWRSDLVFVSVWDVDQIQVEDTYDYASWLQASSHDWLMLTWDTGDLTYHKVTTVAPSGGTLILTFDASLTILGSITKVSFLERTRLASDDVTTTFYRGGEFASQVQTRTVQQ